LTLGLSQAGLLYKGELKDDKITGTMTQSGMEFPLILEKTVITKPGDLSLPSSQDDINKLIELGKGNYKYAVEDYFSRPQSSSFKLSPNGKYLSYMEKEGKKRHVFVKEITTGKVVKAIEEKE